VKEWKLKARDTAGFAPEARKSRGERYKSRILTPYPKLLLKIYHQQHRMHGFGETIFGYGVRSFDRCFITQPRTESTITPSANNHSG
jgi:hypothetical protein